MLIVLKKFFNNFCKKLSNKFYIKNRKLELIKNIKTQTVELINKNNKEIFSKIFMFNDDKELYYILISSKKKAISRNTRKVINNIILDIHKSYKNDACKKINKVPQQIQKLIKNIDELFQ